MNRPWTFTRTLGLMAASVGALVLGMPAGSVFAQGVPLTNITFNLDFTVLGRYAPWYVALAKGYYKDAGLNVKIVPGQGTAQAIQALESGLAQFSFSDVTSLVVASANGTAHAKFVMINYQKPPYAIFSLNPGANVTTPAQLSGLEIGTGAGSFTPKVIRGFMKEKGMNPDSVKFVNIDGAARVGMLLSGKVPAIETFIFGQAGIARSVAAGQKLSTLFLANDGLQLYANGLLVKDDYLKRNPDLVRRFVKASLMGWHDALENPAEAAKLQTQYIPGLSPASVVAEMKVVAELSVTADTKAHGLGSIDPATMKRSVAFVEKYAGLQGTPPATETLYTTAFLPKAPVLP